MWTYLKFKGPLFLVEDKIKQKKIVLLNQCTMKDFIQPVVVHLFRSPKDINFSLSKWVPMEAT